MTKIKTEKRKAVNGDNILITDAVWSAIAYKNGDIFPVTDTHDSKFKDIAVYIKGERWFILDSEYEVIIDEDYHEPKEDHRVESSVEIIDFTKKMLDNLRIKAYQEGFEAGQSYEKKRVEIRKLAKKSEDEKNKVVANILRAGSINLSSVTLLTDLEVELCETPQQKRDRIIKKAKSDYGKWLKNVKFALSGLEVIVNKEKKTVVILQKSVVLNNVIGKGIAKCLPDDCFNVHIGKIIAFYRLMGVKVPQEYLDVPNPTEIRVGDVVVGNDSDYFYSSNKKFTLTDKLNEDHMYYESEGFYYKETDGDFIRTDQIGAIVDDSRE